MGFEAPRAPHQPYTGLLCELYAAAAAAVALFARSFLELVALIVTTVSSRARPYMRAPRDRVYAATARSVDVTDKKGDAQTVLAG